MCLDMIRCVQIGLDVVRYDQVCLDCDQVGLDWNGLDQIRCDQIGLDWFRLDQM